MEPHAKRQMFGAWGKVNSARVWPAAIKPTIDLFDDQEQSASPDSTLYK